MAVKLKFSSNRVDLICTGIITGKDLFDANEDLYHHEYNSKSLIQFVDFTNVSKFDIYE